MRIVKPTGSLSERPTRVCRSLRVPELAGTPRADDAQPSWDHEVVRRHFSASGMSGRSFPLLKSIPLTSLCVLPSPPRQQPGQG